MGLGTPALVIKESEAAVLVISEAGIEVVNNVEESSRVVVLSSQVNTVNTGGGGSGVTVSLWEPETSFVENQLVAYEGELLRTLRNFKSGRTYEF